MRAQCRQFKVAKVEVKSVILAVEFPVLLSLLHFGNNCYLISFKHFLVCIFKHFLHYSLKPVVLLLTFFKWLGINKSLVNTLLCQILLFVSSK